MSLEPVEEQGRVAGLPAGDREPIRSRSFIDGLRRVGPVGQGSLALLAYAAVSFALYAAPIVTQLSTRYVGVGKGDSRLYMWALQWWPHALSRGMNPLSTTEVWAPRGLSLAWVTTQPGPSVLMWPVTRVIGPLVSYNLLLLVSPPLAAWGAYLVCRRVTERFWPSLAGGYLFGFSTYIVGQMHGHVNLVLIFPVPLCVYLVLRRLDGTLRPAPFVLLLTVALLGLFSISTEVFATTAFFGGMALLGTFLLGPGHLRRPLLATGGLIGLAYLLTGIASIPYLYEAFTHMPTNAVRTLTKASVDLLSFVVPRFSTLVGGTAFRSITNHFTATVVEDGAYLGIPLILALVGFLVTKWRSRAAWLLVGFIVLAALLSLGPVLHVKGEPSVGFPEAAVAKLPLLKHATPERFTMFMWLGVAVAAAVWLAARSRWAWVKWGVVAVGAVLILPDVHSPPYHPVRYVPPFFADGIYRTYLSPGEIVAIVPRVWGEEMYWQAESGFYFRLAAGYVGPLPPQYQDDAAAHGLGPGLPVPSLDAFLGFLNAHEVRHILLADPVPDGWQKLLQAVGGAPEDVGGVTVLGIGTGGPAASRTGVAFQGQLRLGGTLSSFTLPGLNGGLVGYERFGGKPLVLGFFASWCRSCAAQLAAYEQVHRLFGHRVGVLAVAQSDGAAKARALLRSVGVTFPAAGDPLGEFFQGFHGTAMPLTIIIGPDGRIQAVHGGDISAGRLAALVAHTSSG